MLLANQYYPKYRTTPAGRAGVVLPLFVVDDPVLFVRFWTHTVQPIDLIEVLFRQYNYDPGYALAVAGYDVRPEELIPGFLVVQGGIDPFEFQYRHIYEPQRDVVYVVPTVDPYVPANTELRLFITKEEGRLKNLADKYATPVRGKIVKEIHIQPECVLPLFTPEEAAHSISKVFDLDEKRLLLFFTSAQASGIFEHTIIDLLLPVSQEKTFEKLITTLEKEGVL